MNLEVDEEYLGSLLHSRRAASIVQKPEYSMSIFRYLATITPAIHFAQPTRMQLFSSYPRTAQPSPWPSILKILIIWFGPSIACYLPLASPRLALCWY